MTHNFLPVLAIVILGVVGYATVIRIWIEVSERTKLVTGPGGDR